MRSKSRQTAEPQGEVLDLKAAAAFLKVSKPTFYRWLAQGRIKGFRAGQQWRFYRADLEKFLEAEEPSALQTDPSALRRVVEQARKARGLKPADWPETDTPEETAVIRTVNLLIADAIDARASDIHIDLEQDKMLVRYRIDGVLHEAMTAPKKFAPPIVARMKLLGDMNVDERRLPQHGRLHIEHQGKDYDLRVTTLPTIWGEALAARILDQSSVLIGLDRLGFSGPMQQTIDRLLSSPTGMIVAAGPAGSGRTTTLYSMLQRITSPHKKTLTIEDPVEYRIPNTTQVHVNRKAGLTMAVALRAFQRADPDIILVAELADPEVLAAAVQAGMTGHLVLTTMHASDAPLAIKRMADMGVDPYLLASSLIAVLAQRLVRRVCSNCAASHEPPADLLRRLAARTGLDLSQGRFRRGAGCSECRQTGYRGRTGIYELLEVTHGIAELIARPVSVHELRAAALEAGMTTMLRDGIEKAAQGITTIEEVLRVLVPPEAQA